MKCPNCGSEVSAQAVHCKSCGMILPGTAYTQTNSRPGPASRYGFVNTNTAYTGNIAAGTYPQTPYQGQQLYGQIPYGYVQTSASYPNAGYGYPVEYYQRRQSPQEKNLFYNKILTTLLALSVVLDLLLIIMLFLR